MKALKRLFFLSFALLLTVALMSGCGEQEELGPYMENSGSASETEPPEPYQFKSSELENYVIVYTGENTEYYKLALKLKNQIYTSDVLGL
jgi:uncharacterized lipoprotein YehR (DUF1307 family)